MTVLNFEKLRDVKTPSRSYSHAAAWDFYVPDNWKRLRKGLKLEQIPYDVESPEWQTKTLWPGEQLLCPSGLRIQLSPGYTLVFFNKSGNATRGLLVGATVVDPDYQGEIHLHVWNVSTSQQIINQGDKLLQAMLIPIIPTQLHEIEPTATLFPKASDRGRSGFGSTGRIH